MVGPGLVVGSGPMVGPPRVGSIVGSGTDVGSSGVVGALGPDPPVEGFEAGDDSDFEDEEDGDGFGRDFRVSGEGLGFGLDFFVSGEDGFGRDLLFDLDLDGLDFDTSDLVRLLALGLDLLPSLSSSLRLLLDSLFLLSAVFRLSSGGLNRSSFLFLSFLTSSLALLLVSDFLLFLFLLLLLLDFVVLLLLLMLELPLEPFDFLPVPLLLPLELFPLDRFELLVSLLDLESLESSLLLPSLLLVCFLHPFRPPALPLPT